MLCVFEFPPGDAEWQLRDLANALQGRVRGLRIEFCYGFLKSYKPGGLSLRRISNGIFVHIRAFVRCLLGSYSVVLVRSSPPLIQITIALAARLRGMPYWVWLMDAHPEIEQVEWGRIWGVGWLLRRLQDVNASCLSGAEVVVVPDQAMSDRFVRAVTSDRILICPTWGNGTCAPISGRPASKSAPEAKGLNFAYIGNLGFAHDVPLLCRFLVQCANRVPVEISFISTSREAVASFQERLGEAKITVRWRPRVPDFLNLLAVIREAEFDYGIVIMSEQFAGLLSPSKFIGYLAGDLPIIYLGPANTNAAVACDRFQAGVRMDATMFDSNGANLVEMIIARDGSETMRRNIAAVLAHFAQYNGEYLAREILRQTAALGVRAPEPARQGPS